MNIKRFLLNYLQTQLIVTIVALPILVNWGLPLSFATFFANLVFAPVLMVVLVLSSLIFFSELLCIPNGFLIFLYDNVVLCWHTVLLFGKKSWLVSFAHPGIFILICFPVITFIFLRHRKINTIGRRIVLMVVMLACSCTVLWGLQTRQKKSWYHEKFIVKKNRKGQWVFIDDGFFNTKRSPEKTIEFELKTFLSKKFGSIVFDKLILKRIGMRSFAGALGFCKVFDVKKVVFPYFDHELSKGAWRNYFELKRYVRDNNIKLSRYDHNL